MTSEAHDEVKLDRSGRERGAWVYLDAFTLERAGIALNASEDVYAKRTGCRVGSRKRVILSLTVKPRVLSPQPPFDVDKDHGDDSAGCPDHGTALTAGCAWCASRGPVLTKEGWV
jgi:hypothetical protein